MLYYILYYIFQQQPQDNNNTSTPLKGAFTSTPTNTNALGVHNQLLFLSRKSIKSGWLRNTNNTNTTTDTYKGVDDTLNEDNNTSSSDDDDDVYTNEKLQLLKSAAVALQSQGEGCDNEYNKSGGLYWMSLFPFYEDEKVLFQG